MAHHGRWPEVFLFTRGSNSRLSATQPTQTRIGSTSAPLAIRPPASPMSPLKAVAWPNYALCSSFGVPTLLPPWRQCEGVDGQSPKEWWVACPGAWLRSRQHKMSKTMARQRSEGGHLARLGSTQQARIRGGHERTSPRHPQLDEAGDMQCANQEPQCEHWFAARSRRSHASSRSSTVTWAQHRQYRRPTSLPATR